MSDQMSTDALELFCRNRAKASGELTDYDRALLVDVSDRLCALQAENAELREESGCMCHNVSAMQATLDQQAKNCEELLAEKDKEIERIRLRCPVQVDGDVMALTLELAETKAALARMEAERDAAVADVPHDCEHCKYAEVNGACKLLPDGDEFSPDYTDGFDRDGNCDHWEWRGVQGEA